MTKNAQKWTFIPSGFLEKRHRQVTHAFQFGKRQSWRPDLSSNREADEIALLFLCFHSVYRLYLRTDTVPSRWDTQSEPRGTFFRED